MLVEWQCKDACTKAAGRCETIPQKSCSRPVSTLAWRGNEAPRAGTCRCGCAHCEVAVPTVPVGSSFDLSSSPVPSQSPTRILVPGHLHKAHRYRCSFDSGLTPYILVWFFPRQPYSAPSRVRCLSGRFRCPIRFSLNSISTFAQSSFPHSERQFRNMSAQEYFHQGGPPQGYNQQQGYPPQGDYQQGGYQQGGYPQHPQQVRTFSPFHLSLLLVSSIVLTKLRPGLRCASTTTRWILPTTSPDAVPRATAAQETTRQRWLLTDSLCHIALLLYLRGMLRH